MRDRLRNVLDGGPAATGVSSDALQVIERESTMPLDREQVRPDDP
ncbi:hypothetical protein [Antribacter soli]|nr:hypothetical protein [Antribacter soli]